MRVKLIFFNNNMWIKFKFLINPTKIKQNNKMKDFQSSRTVSIDYY